MPAPTLDDLTVRVNQLERRSRRDRRCLIAAVVVASGLAVALGAQPARVVEAEIFMVRGKDGKFRGHFGTLPSGEAELSMMGADSKSAVVTRVGDGKVTFGMFTAKSQLSLGASDRDGTDITLSNEAGGTLLVSVDDEAGMIHFKDAKKNTRFDIAIDHALNMVSARLHDVKGEPNLTLTVMPDGEPALTLTHQGKRLFLTPRGLAEMPKQPAPDPKIGASLAEPPPEADSRKLGLD